MVEFRYSQTVLLRFTVILFHSNLDQKLTSNEQKVTSNNQEVTSNEQKLTSNEQKVQPQEKKHDKIVLLGKTKLNSIEVLIS